MKPWIILLVLPALWSCSEKESESTTSKPNSSLEAPLESPTNPPVTNPGDTTPTPPVPPVVTPTPTPVPPVVTPDPTPVPPVVTPPVVVEPPPVVNPPTPPPLVCTPGLVKVTRPTRVLFLVDQSGSNLNGPYEYPMQPTDPLKVFRLKVMNDFVAANTAKDHVTWSLSTFNDTKAQSLMSPSLKNPYGSVADFGKALKNFGKAYDYGRSPYRPALQMAQSYIEKDLLTAPKETAYLIAFLTDGYPTDYCEGGITEFLCPGKILENEIDADVRRIIRLNPRNIKFSTVYYGKPDGDAVSRLRRMAEKGLGQFVDANVTSDIDPNDVMYIEQEVCVPPTDT